MEKLRIGSVQEIKRGIRKGHKVKIIGRAKVKEDYIYLAKHLDDNTEMFELEISSQLINCLGKKYREEIKSDILLSSDFVENQNNRLEKMIGTIQEIEVPIEVPNGAVHTIPKGTKVKIIGIHKEMARYSRCPMYIVEWGGGYMLSTYLEGKTVYPVKLMEGLERNTRVWVIFEDELKGFGGSDE